jgi:hypothetical protein
MRIVKTTARTFRPGDHIAWGKDHVRIGTRTGRVGSQHGERIYAWPDDRNHGPERNGGCSEVDLCDVLGFVVVG